MEDRTEAGPARDERGRRVEPVEPDGCAGAFESAEHRVGQVHRSQAEVVCPEGAPDDEVAAVQGRTAPDLRELEVPLYPRVRDGEVTAADDHTLDDEIPRHTETREVDVPLHGAVAEPDRTVDDSTTQKHRGNRPAREYKVPTTAGGFGGPGPVAGRAGLGALQLRPCHRTASGAGGGTPSSHVPYDSTSSRMFTPRLRSFLMLCP